jgi:hypothetical protein
VEKRVKDISEIIKAMDYLIPAQPALDGEAPLSEDEAFLLLLPRLLTELDASNVTAEIFGGRAYARIRR